MNTKLVKIRYFQPKNSGIISNSARWVTAIAELGSDGWLSEIGKDGRSFFQNGCYERLQPDEYLEIEEDLSINPAGEID